MKVAVVGLGFMGLTHMKAWRNVPGVELAAVSSDDPKALSGDLSGIQGNLDVGGETFDFSSIDKYSDAFECVRNARVDAVDLCLPTKLHAPVALAALEAGKHVLVEKPMGLDGAACDQMIQAASKAGRILMSAHVLRFSPPYQHLLEGLASGRFGKIRNAMFRRRCAAPAWSLWMGDRKQSGGGVFDLLIHDVDIALAAFGLPEAVSAWGVEELSRGLDVLTAQLHYPDIASVTITGGWHHPKSYPFSAEYTVSGDNGTLEFSSAGRPPKFYGADGTETLEPQTGIDGYQAEIAYFAECCRTGVQPARCTSASSAAAVRVTRLAQESRARKGEILPCKF
jgi:predicted dehydrogenase